MNRRFDHFPPGSERFIDHPSQALPGIHPYPDRLHVLTMLENPLRWRSRYQNFSRFERMVEESGALLYIAEVAFENRTFEVTEAGNPRHLQLRANSELWRKENALNLLAARLPVECQKLAVLDADIEFARRDWAQEILHQLAHYDVIQPFSHALNLGPGDAPQPQSPPTSFMYQWQSNGGIAPHEAEFLDERLVRWSGRKKAVWTTEGQAKPEPPKPVVKKKQTSFSFSGGAMVGPGAPGVIETWHPGLAWAFRKSAWNALGGLPDWLPTGSGDWHLAHALIGQLMDCIDPRHTPSYKRHCQILQDRGITIRDNPEGGVGHMPGLLLHRFHGTHKNRQYEHRHKFIINVEYDPDLDLKRDISGLWQLTDRNPKFRDGMRIYGRMRVEDEGM